MLVAWHAVVSARLQASFCLLPPKRSRMLLTTLHIPNIEVVLSIGHRWVSCFDSMCPVSN